MISVEVAQSYLWAWLFNYLIHSTAFVALITIANRIHTQRVRRSSPALRALAWKAALLAPIFSSFSVTLASQHLGITWQVTTSTPLAEAKEMPDGLGADRFNHLDDWQDVDSSSSTFPNVDGSSLHSKSDSPISEDRTPTLKPSAIALTQTRVPWRGAIWVLLAFAFINMSHLVLQCHRLASVVQRSVPITDKAFNELLEQRKERMRINGAVRLAQSSEVNGPLVAGILRPSIVVPNGLLEELDTAEQTALLSHELAHIARRDAAWKFACLMVNRLAFFQPLNGWAFRQMSRETEFAADEVAAQTWDHRLGLAGCLAHLGHWMSTGPQPAPMAIGMAAFPELTGAARSGAKGAFRSELGQRVEALLNHHPEAPLKTLSSASAACWVAATVVILAVAPRWTFQSTSVPGNDDMQRPLTTAALMVALTAPVAGQDTPQNKPAARPPITKKTADALPDGIERFNGVLVGRLVSKDVEKGEFIINVDAIPRVWRNSRAQNPKSIVGKNIRVDGVVNKWLDALLLIREGETLEVEARHDGDNHLTFPGELLRKVAPYQPGDYPELPEEFRGFVGAVTAKVTKKDPDTFELIVQVERVIDEAKDSRAKNAESIQNKPMMLAGFWRRKDEYHGLKVGDRIDVGLRHITPRSDHLNVDKFVRKVGAGEANEKTPRNEPRAKEGGKEAPAGFPAGMRGFRGIFIGTLVSKDVERGEFVVKAEKVTRLWRRNAAKNPKAGIGYSFPVKGVEGKFLDVLVQTKVGERLEVEAFHNSGESLDFVGELLRKVE